MLPDDCLYGAKIFHGKAMVAGQGDFRLDPEFSLTVAGLHMDVHTRLFP
jgi:hypothetical protein